MLSIKAFLRVPLQIRSISTTQCLFAEPLKKKKKIDPAIIKQREERRRKKLEKQIRRLEKNARQLKPVEELEVPIELLDQKKERSREVVAQDVEARALLIKSWARYKHQEKVSDFQIIDRLLESQNQALEELRLESEELYQEAVQVPNILPLITKGPVATPPVEGYNSPDGDYLHKAKKWDKTSGN